MGIFRPNFGEDHKKRSSPPIPCVIFRSILSDDKRKKSVRHFEEPIFGRNLELTGDNFHKVSESKNDWYKL